MAIPNGLQRILFALFAAPAFVALLWAGGYWRFGILTFLLGASMWEYARILRRKFPEVGILPETWLPTIACVIAWLSPWGPFGCLWTISRSCLDPCLALAFRLRIPPSIP